VLGVIGKDEIIGEELEDEVEIEVEGESKFDIILSLLLLSSLGLLLYLCHSSKSL
jgi:hypothetical protein